MHIGVRPSLPMDIEVHREGQHYPILCIYRKYSNFHDFCDFLDDVGAGSAGREGKRSS